MSVELISGRTVRWTLRSLTAVLLTAVALGAAPLSASPAQAGGDTGVAVLNELRSLSGLPPVSADAQMASDALAHSRYMVRTGTISHHEDPTSPHYTKQGDQAARESNLKVSSSASLSVRDAVHGLMSAPFHGVGFIDPRLTRSGGAMFSDSNASPWRSGYTINVLRGRSSTAPSGTTYPIVWPGNGSTVALDRYRGNEMPDPLTSCPGYKAPTGLPLIVQFSANQPVRSATVTTGGTSAGACVFDGGSYRNPDGASQSTGRGALSARNAAIIIPKAPLGAGQVQVELVTSAGTLRWSFTVGDSNIARSTPSAVPPEPAPRTTLTPPVRSIDEACPSGKVPDAGYDDVPSSSAHSRAVDCVTWWEVARGSTANEFRPHGVVTRAQMAAFIANAIDRSGGSLPSSPTRRFRDTLGSVHDRTINQLAQAGIVSGVADDRYAPDQPVTRAQMATFLVRAYEYRTGQRLETRTGYFYDTAQSSHARMIDTAATAGFVGGRSAGRYDPEMVVPRAGMASFVARMLDRMVDERVTRTPKTS